MSTSESTPSPRPDGIVLFGRWHETRYWRDILLIVGGTLFALHEPEFHRVLTLRGAKLNYFALEARHLSAPGEILGSDYWVETKLNAAQTVRLARRMLELFGYPVSELRVLIEVHHPPDLAADGETGVRD